MALLTVQLTCDLYDGSGTPVTTGQIAFYPTVTVTDSADHTVITKAPVIIPLIRNPLPVVALVATDSPGLLPSGWAWRFEAQFPGAPAPATYFLAHASGASQYLSALLPTSVAPSAYTLIPVTGTPSAGQVITATSPTAADWETPDGGLAISSVSTDIQPLGTRAAGSSGLAADARHVHPTTSVIAGVTVSGTPVSGNALTATSGTTAGWSTPAAGVTLDANAAHIAALGSSAAAGSQGKAADSGHVHPTTGLAVLDAVATDIQPLGTRAAGSTGLAADAGHVHPTTSVIAGVTVSGTPVAGNALTATSGSAAHWATPAAGVTLDTTDADIQQLGVQSAGATGLAADAGHVHPATGVAVIDTVSSHIAALGTRAAGAVGQAADSGHVHPTTGLQTAVITSTPTDIHALGTQSAGSTGKLADAGHVHPTTGVALLAGATFTGAVVPAMVPLTDASTVVVNAALGNHFVLTATSGVGATRKLGNPSGGGERQKIIVEFVQDSSGSRALTFDTNYSFSADLPDPTGTFSTAASKRDFLGFVFDSGAGKWRLLALNRGF